MFPLSIMSLLVTEAVDTVGGMIVEPVLPIYMRNSVGVSPFHVTCMSAAYSLVQVLVNVRLGALSDRVGRKPVLVCGIIGEAVFYTALAPCGTFGAILAMRTLLGVAASTDPVVTSYIMDHVDDDAMRKAVLNRKQQISQLCVAGGSTLGSVLYGALGWPGLCLIMACVCASQAVAGSLFWAADAPKAPRASPAATTKAGGGGDGGDDAPSAWAAVRSHYVWPVIFYQFTSSFIASTFIGILPFSLQDRFGFSDGEWSLFIGAFNVLMFVFSQCAPFVSRHVG